jgi:hypothetical protein
MIFSEISIDYLYEIFGFLTFFRYICKKYLNRMSKIFGFYSNDVDKTWYQSSNIKYSECIDHDNDLKTLKVVFNNGTQYQYNKVDVRDYLFFKNDSSQGKALNQFIKGKGYEYEKLENADVKSLEDELNFRMEGGTFIFYDGGKLTMKDSLDKVILEKEVELTSDTFDAICDALNAVGKELYVDGKNFKDGQE